MEKKTYKKFDTFATTTYYVKLAQDAKVFTREDKGEDVVLTFCDNSRIEGTEELWVDARIARFQADRAKLYRHGDPVQITGKLRFKRQNDGAIRGKIYDATVDSFVYTKDREVTGTESDVPAPGDPVPPQFE